MINRRYGNIINIVNYIVMALISVILVLSIYLKMVIDTPQYVFYLLLGWCVLNLIIEIRRKSYGLIAISIIYAGTIIAFLVI